jgi:hypothetical protein
MPEDNLPEPAADDQLWPAEDVEYSLPADHHNEHEQMIDAEFRDVTAQDQLDLSDPNVFVARCQYRCNAMPCLVIPSGLRDTRNLTTETTVTLVVEHPETSEHATIRDQPNYKGVFKLPQELFTYWQLENTRCKARIEEVEHEESGGLFSRLF